MPEENRIGTRLNYAASTVLNSKNPWSGQMELSYGLRYQASDQTVRLDQVRMEGFQVDGCAGCLCPAAARRGHADRRKRCCKTWWCTSSSPKTCARSKAWATSRGS